MTKTRIYIAGHRGMVGSALIRLLKKNQNVEIIAKDKSELNLINQASVEDFLKRKILIKFILQQQELVAFMPIALFQLNLFIKIL